MMMLDGISAHCQYLRFGLHIKMLTKQDIRNEEDRACNVVLIASEAEVLVHAFDFCIADVCTVNVREEVQHCHDGDKTHVDLGCVSAVS